MNIAFPALLIFLFVLPGFVFNLAFFKTDNTPLNYIPLTHKAIVSFVVTIILHTIWLLCVCYLLHLYIDLDLILVLIAGVQGVKYSEAITSITAHELISTAMYLITMYAFAYALGKSLRLGIRYFKLDEKYGLFRIDSPWYYLFSGYDWENGEPDGVRIAATSEIAGRGYLYIGWLDKFYLDNAGNIERLILTSTVRREIKKDKKVADENAERFYRIEGDYFVLKYAEIKSLNVQFFKIEEISK